MNLENLNLSELNAQEVQEVGGGDILLDLLINNAYDIYRVGSSYYRGLKDGLSGI
jgi:hypothetical protein